MPVKRVKKKRKQTSTTATTKTKKKLNIPTSRNRQDFSLDDLKLPDSKKKREPDLSRYIVGVYGRPGVGKTTLLASFPDAVLLSCERVSKAVEAFDFNAENGGVYNWEIFCKAVQLLEKNSRKFKTVCIDTIDAAYNHCKEYVCKKRGIAHPQEEGYGIAWDAIKTEFQKWFDRLLQTNRGIAFSSHAKETEITAPSGVAYNRIQPTMSNQAYGVIKAKSDFVLYGEFVKDTNSKSRRILITQGDELIDAKSPEGEKGKLPKYIPLELHNGYGVISDAFAGEDVGIPVSEIFASKETSETANLSLTKEKAKTIRRKKKK